MAHIYISYTIPKQYTPIAKVTKYNGVMAYNRRNKLKLIIDIQNIVLEYKEKYGSGQEWIYYNKIYPIYRISRATYYTYLGINAKRELSKLTMQDKQQPLLF